MASMFAANSEHLSLLDAGAGVGSLTAAFVNEICERRRKVSSLHVTAYEIDGTLSEYLASTLQQCREMCHHSGIQFTFDLIQSDFIEESTRSLRHEMFVPVRRFNCAILNPPYREINSDSETRVALRKIGQEPQSCI
jgi:adenine-specific DNA-methyltransferase